MGKKWQIEEIWLLDDNGNRTLELKQFDPKEIFKDCIDIENIRGGKGTSWEPDRKYNYIKRFKQL